MDHEPSKKMVARAAQREIEAAMDAAEAIAAIAARIDEDTEITFEMIDAAGEAVWEMLMHEPTIGPSIARDIAEEALRHGFAVRRRESSSDEIEGSQSPRSKREFAKLVEDWLDEDEDGSTNRSLVESQGIGETDEFLRRVFSVVAGAFVLRERSARPKEAYRSE